VPRIAAAAVSRGWVRQGLEGCRVMAGIMGGGDLVAQYTNCNEPSTNGLVQSLNRPVSIQRSRGFRGKIQTIPATR
jgi:hypothetical protein